MIELFDGEFQVSERSKKKRKENVGILLHSIPTRNDYFLWVNAKQVFVISTDNISSIIEHENSPLIKNRKYG